MSNRLFRALGVKTVTARIAVITVALGLVIFLLMNAILPKVFFDSLKNYITQPVLLMTREAASQISFQLMGNSQVMGRAKYDAGLTELLTRYSEQPKDQDAMKASMRASIEDALADPNLMLPGGGFLPTLPEISISIVSESREVFYRQDAKRYIEAMLQLDWYQTYQPVEGRRIYTPIFEVDGRKLIGYINTVAIGAQLYDYVYITLADRLIAAFDPLNEQNVSDILILGANNEVLYSAAENTGFALEHIGKATPQFQVFVNEYKDGVDFYTLASSEDEGFKIGCHADNAILFEPFMPLVLFVELMIGLSMVLLIVAAGVSVRVSLANLKNMLENIRKIQHGDYSARVSIATSDELETLGEALNTMVERVVEHEASAKEMQYKVLISEIDPHFIYNTLNTITYLAKLNRPDDVIIVNRALIAMLKDRLKIKGYESFDLLKNEVEVINQYMIIQKYLYDDAVALTWDIADDLMNERIPKNILQPLVENAILHGLLAKKDAFGEVLPGEIIISVKRKDDRLNLTVKDSGKGMSDEMIAAYFSISSKHASKPGESIGIKNIIMRLTYLFGDYWYITADSNPGEGTMIEIDFPLGKRAGEETE